MHTGWSQGGSGRAAPGIQVPTFKVLVPLYHLVPPVNALLLASPATSAQQHTLAHRHSCPNVLSQLSYYIRKEQFRPIRNVRITLPLSYKAS